MKRVLLGLFEDFSALFYPHYCLGCSDALVKGEETVCTRCMLEMPQTHHHLDVHNTLKNRLSARFPLTYAMAFYKFSKRGRIQHLLHALKYRNRPEVGITLGKVYGEKLRSAGYSTAFDLIVPVPLHPSRLRKRGYNQSAKFAEGLSALLMIPFTDSVMKRSIKTATQTRKTKLLRWQNVSDVFSVEDTGLIRNLRVLLVDDVITTGATLEACGLVLLQHGCRELSVACIAEA